MVKGVAFMVKQRCNICQHEEAKAINKALVEGRTLQSIADQYGVHVSSLSRHKPHLSEKIRAAAVFNEAVEGASLLQRVEGLLQKASDLLNRAENSGDLRVALQGVREVRSCLELLGKASGELTPDRLLVEFAPVITNITAILRQEVTDPASLQRISNRLLALDTIEMEE